jgi:hypothetical protein
MAGIRAYWNQYIKGADSTTEMPAAVGVTGDAAHVMLADSSGTALGTAAAGLPVVDANLVPIEFVQSKAISASSTMNDVFVDDSSTLPSDATVALIQALTQNVRWRDDGTAPTASKGMQLAAGDQFWYTGDLSTIRFIEEAATAELNVTVYKQA